LGLIERIQADRRAEQRVIGGVPWRPWDSPYWKFSSGGPVHPTRAFYGTDKALGLPALYSCTRLIAESIASLPLKIYTRAPGNGGPAVRYRGPSIFDRPSATSNIYDWVYQCLTSLVLHGNAWGLITGRDGYQYPTGIEWIPPDMVQVEDDQQEPWNPLRTRVYVYGRLIPNWREELFHIRAFTLPGRTEGISPLRAFALTVLNGMEAQRYGTDWFAAGGFPPGTFQNNEIEIDATAAAEIRESLTASIRQRQPLVFGRDWDYKPVVVPPAEAQFIETMQMNATQLAAIYGLPPDRVGGRRGDSLTYNTVEQSTLQVIEALRPWLVRLETAFFELLPSNRYCRFNADALLKTDLKTRVEIQSQQRAMGLFTIDEIRDEEDREPYPDSAGDEKIPLEVMVAMSRSIRAIPNSMLKGITLEVDLISDRLEKLEKEGLSRPDTGPSVPNTDDFLSSQIGSVRAVKLFKALTEAGFDTTVANQVVKRSLDDDRENKAYVKKAAPAPEFVGPWVPSDEDLARLSAAGGNGNGRHHLCRRERKTNMAEMSSSSINDLPDSAFAYIEPGGAKDPGGKTVPRSKRHFPVHDEAHARNALARAPQSPFGKMAMPKIMSAARKFNIKVSGAQRSAFGADAMPDSAFPERRFTRFPLEVRRERDGGPQHIYGYAACFDKLSRKLGGFVEQVSHTAFDTSRSDGWPDVVCRFNHKDDLLLGTTYARTLDLHIDETGLAYDVVPPQSRADILEYCERGDIRHSSFAFRVFPGGDEWGVSEFNYPMRTLLAVQLVDVAPVLDPAYPDSTAAARAINGAVESLSNWVQGDPEEVRSRLSDGRAMEFFKRTDNIGPKVLQKTPPKPVLSGAQAMLALQANMDDPFIDEG
jgi:HK97 family phage portal protein/HK97 family phage prohead protease